MCLRAASQCGVGSWCGRSPAPTALLQYAEGAGVCVRGEDPAGERGSASPVKVGKTAGVGQGEGVPRRRGEWCGRGVREREREWVV